MLPKVLKSFSDLGLNNQITEACKCLGWNFPTDIQSETIPEALNGRNVIGLAETGSGKTAAYALPILNSLMIAPKYYYALILTPTRELASQVQAQFTALGKIIGLNTSLLVGGTPIVEQTNQMLLKPPHIIIATPGRFIDHLKRTKGFDELKLQNLKFLVIDEADRLLGSDFESVIEKVLIVLPPKRQTFLFSATMTEKVGKLQRASLRDPVRISTSKSKFQSVASLRQFVHLVPQAELDTYLVCLLKLAFSPKQNIDGLAAIHLYQDMELVSSASESNCESIGSAIVFTRTRDTSNRVSLLLKQFLTTPVITLNGDMPHAQRLGALAKFKKLPMSILVATDVASRGLDIPQVGLVINFDVPLDAKTYMHRVGRTARAGRVGCALTLLTQFSVVFYLKEIESHLLTATGCNQEKINALIPPDSQTDAELDAAVQELNQEVKAAMLLAGKTLSGLQRKGHGRIKNFVSVDDLKTPSTNEICVPIGTKRTGWGSEAPEKIKQSINTVLSMTSIVAKTAETEEREITASKQMPHKSRKGKPTSEKVSCFKPAYKRRDELKKSIKRGGSSMRGRSSGRGKRQKNY